MFPPFSFDLEGFFFFASFGSLTSFCSLPYFAYLPLPFLAAFLPSFLSSLPLFDSFEGFLTYAVYS